MFPFVCSSFNPMHTPKMPYKTGRNDDLGIDLQAVGHKSGQIVEFNALGNVLRLDVAVLVAHKYQITLQLPAVLLYPAVEGAVCSQKD